MWGVCEEVLRKVWGSVRKGVEKYGRRCQVSVERCEEVLRAVWGSVRGEAWKVWREA